MSWKTLKKRRYMISVTPIEYLTRVTDHLGGPKLYIKRDDISTLAGGGNKTRKLEYLVADALDKGADILITCGAYQSNHARLTLAAARKEGLKCRLILKDPNGFGSASAHASGNLFLDRLMNADKIQFLPKEADLSEALEEEVVKCLERDENPYGIPLGGSNALGAMGYVDCAFEIAAFEASTGLEFDYVIVPVGSGGTQAGLVAGLKEAGSNAKVIGMNVLMEKSHQEPAVWKLVREIQIQYGVGLSAIKEDVISMDEGLGAGYAMPTEGMIESVRLLAEKEGILLDPTYTGKAFSGLMSLIRKGFFRKEDRILFVHTGGSVALFEHQNWFIND